MEIRLRTFLTLFTFFLTLSSFAQVTGKVNTLNVNRIDAIPMCMANTIENKRLLEYENIKVKYENENWIYFTLINKDLSKCTRNFIENIYVEISTPTLLSDSARAKHYVDSVHLGTG